MPEALLSISGLSAGYEQPVVGPLSFQVNAGEVVGLAGANGCGKSTVLRALVGAAQVFAGRVEKAAGVRVALQSQHSSRPEELPLRARELLQLMNVDVNSLPPRLQALLDDRLDRLSGGQRQLFMVWAALAHPARLVLLDEPTNNLDPDGVALLTRQLSALEPERGALVVSHETEFLREACDRVIQL